MKGLKHVISISNYQISRNMFHAEHHILQPSCFYSFYHNVIPFSLETEERGSYCCQPTKLQDVRAQKNITWM